MRWRLCKVRRLEGAHELPTVALLYAVVLVLVLALSVLL